MGMEDAMSGYYIPISSSPSVSPSFENPFEITIIICSLIQSTWLLSATWCCHCLIYYCYYRYLVVFFAFFWKKGIETLSHMGGREQERVWKRENKNELWNGIEQIERIGCAPGMNQQFNWNPIFTLFLRPILSKNEMNEEIIKKNMKEKTRKLNHITHTQRAWAQTLVRDIDKAGALTARPIVCNL